MGARPFGGAERQERNSVVQAIDDARRQRAGRVPPHNLEAEESLLGAMLLSRDAITAAVEAHVEASDYYKPAHVHIHEAVMALYGQGEPVDPVTIAEELRRAEVLDAVGGRASLLRIQAATPASANAGHYARIVNELALLRRLIGVAGDIAEMGYDTPDDVAETLDRAESMVFEVAERRVSESLAGISDSLQTTLDQLESMYGSDTEVVGVPSGYHELDSLLLGLQRSNLVIVAARPSMGKCVAWDTPIVDPATGAVRTAQEVYERGRAGRPVRVLALDDDLRVRSVAPSAFVDDGVKPVYKVTTRTGRVVRTTITHPFLTGDGWKPLAEVCVGDRVAVPRAIDAKGHDSLPEAEVVMLGFLIGSGCLADGSPMMSTASPSVLLELQRCAAKLGVTVRHTSPHDHRLCTPLGRPSPVTTLLRQHGLWKTESRAKHIPDAVYRLPAKQLALFLNRLFAANGWASVHKGGQVSIGFGSRSDRLARGVQHLLLRFGVASQLRHRTALYNGRGFPSWQIEVSHPESIRRFAADIGILGKEDAVDRVLVALERRSRSSNLDTIPATFWGEVLKAKGDRTWRSVSEAAGKPPNYNWHVGTRSPQRETLALLAEVLDARDLELLATSDIWWDEIASIVYVGDEQVYDLTVPNVHNFVAGDMFVHNTSFALGAAANVAVSVQRPVMFFSMEMGNLELTKRLLAAEGRVEAKRLWTGNIPESDWSRLSHAVGRLAEAPLFIDDNPHCTVMEMRAKARRIRARHGDLGLIVVDYIQLMSSTGSRQIESRQVEVAELSRGLKILARELDCPVMALSQLNRQLEYRQDKRPMLADLRESGGLEQDADVVCFIYRDEVYNPESDQRGQAEILVSKHRNGPTGIARLAFNERFTKFDNMARD
jgi:replicative DNA helicase